MYAHVCALRTHSNRPSQLYNTYRLRMLFVNLTLVTQRGFRLSDCKHLLIGIHVRHVDFDQFLYACKSHKINDIFSCSVYMLRSISYYKYFKTCRNLNKTMRRRRLLKPPFRTRIGSEINFCNPFVAC